MSRRPLIPPQMTVGFAFMGAVVLGLLTVQVVASFAPDGVAYAIGAVVGLAVLVGLPLLVGQTGLVVPIFLGVALLVILVGFVNRAADSGPLVALAIFVPATVVVGAVAWVLNRTIAPVNPNANRGFGPKTDRR